jgi:uncharacterized membrane protein
MNDDKAQAKTGDAVRVPRKHLTLGQKAADKLTSWAGSWTFIGILTSLLILWIAVNAMAYAYRWDPYPFILLNLFLSFMAAYQAPIILMSQNRVTERDRSREERDYQIDRKAEQEIQDMQADLEEIKRMIRKLDVPRKGSE